MQVLFLLTALKDFLQIDFKNYYATISTIIFSISAFGPAGETRWPIVASLYDSGSTKFEMWPESFCRVFAQDLSTLMECISIRDKYEDFYSPTEIETGSGNVSHFGPVYTISVILTTSVNRGLNWLLEIVFCSET